MQWTVRLEARTSAGEVTTTELPTFSRLGVVGTLAEVGLLLAESKTLLAKLRNCSPPFGGVVQIRVTRETWSPLVGAALATFGVTHKPPILNHARVAI